MERKWKWWTGIICVFLLCQAMNSIVFAEESDFVFDNSDFAVTAYNGSGGEVSVPEVLQECPVEIIASSTFYGNDTVTSLTLPETLITLESSNIYMMEALSSVVLPEALVIIDSYNYYGCPNVTEATIPARVTYIGDNSFYDCENLREIRFNGVLPQLGIDCFEYLPEDVTIYVPDDQIAAYTEALPDGINIQSTGENAIVCDYTALEEEFEFDASTGTILAYYGFAARVDIPSFIGGVPVTAIGEGAFLNHRYIYYVTIPEGVTDIGKDAFQNTYHLSWAEFPSTLKSIGTRAFGGYKGSSIKFPEGLETIGDEAFYAAALYNGIYLPEGLTTIRKQAFYWSSASEVYFPTTIESIGEEAFGDSYVSYLYFEGKELPQIAENAFNGLSITDVDLNWKASYEQMLSAQEFFDGIGQSARVWRMQNPNVDYIRDGLDTYENGVMTGYTGEQTHLRPWDTYDEVTVTAIGEGALKGNKTIEYFAVPYNDAFTTIGAEAFADSSVQTVDLFDSVTTIGAGAFRNCTSLTELVLPESVTSIGADAFTGCTALTKLVLPAVLDNQDISAFEGVDTSVIRISDVATDEQVAAWNEKLNTPWYDPVERESEYHTITEMPYAETTPQDFWYDSEFLRLDDYDGYELNLYLPRSIDDVPMNMISANVLNSAKNTWDEVTLPVKSVVIPETAKELVGEAFSDCPDLEVVICYAPLEIVPYNAFANCTSLKNVIFVNGVRNIEMNAFSNCPALEAVYLGNSVEVIDETAFDASFDGFITEIPDLDAMLESVKADPIPAPEEEPETPIPGLDVEAGADYLGRWKGISMEMEGTAVSLEELGMSVELSMNEDGTAQLIMDGEGDTMLWYVEEGTAYMGTCLEDAVQALIKEDGTLYLDEDGFLMVFVRGDSSAEIAPVVSSDPVMEEIETEAAFQDMVSDVPELGTVSEERINESYVCTQVDVGGNKMEASILGAEYSVKFCENGTLDFVMAGADVPGLKWKKEIIQTDDGETDAYVVTYFDGSDLNFVFTESGFELNFFDSMLLYFEKFEMITP